MRKYLCVHSRDFVWLAAKLLLLGLLLLGVFNSALAQSAPQYIGYCNHCSSTGYASAARMAVPPFPGSYSVYVIDTATAEVRFFHVNIQLGDTVDGNDDASSTDTAMPFQGRSLQVEVLPGAGDPTIVSAMQDAHALVTVFALEIYASVTAGDLDSDLESAIDLVGPYDSSAGLARVILENQINNAYQDMWNTLTIAVGDLVARLMNRFLGDGYVTPGGTLTITFPDGTSIQVKLLNILDSIDGEGIRMELEVLTASVQGPGLPGVPQSAGQFNHFTHGGSYVDQLVALAIRYGIPVVNAGEGGGGGGGVPTECEIQDDGNLRCYPRPGSN